MRPVVKRIADEFGHNFSVFVKLLFVRRIARDISLVHAAKAHRAPLVVVARKPQFAYIRKTLVLFYLFVAQMAVIIDNRQISDLIVNTLCLG